MSTYNNLLQVKALLVERPTTGTITLPENNVPQLLSVMGAGQIIDLAGSSISSSETLGYGAVRYFKDVFGSIRDRMGSNNNYVVENTKVADVTIPIDKSPYKAIQLLAEDLSRGLDFILSEKLNNIFKLLLIDRENASLTDLAGQDTRKTGNTLSAADLADGNKVYTKLVDLATGLRDIVDNNQGINKIPADRIIIFASPKILNSLSRVRLLGDGVLTAFSTGSFSVNKVGGYNIVESMYLPGRAEAIITTTFSYKAPWSVKALGIGPKYAYASSDKVALAHIMRGGGVIYTGVTKVIYV